MREGERMLFPEINTEIMVKLSPKKNSVWIKTKVVEVDIANEIFVIKNYVYNMHNKPIKSFHIRDINARWKPIKGTEFIELG